MCGIAVYIGPKAGGGYVRRHQALNQLQHRGPDGLGERQVELARGDILWMGHSRLSILDLSEAGSQPMEDPVTGNLLVFNGEIYNFRQLADELKSEGVVFRSTSDTEVVLAAYRIWGRSCAARFRGMFALALWDQKDRELWCVRDPFGVKPLYVSERQGSWTIGSELHTVLAFQEDDVRIDTGGCFEFLNFGAPHSPGTIVPTVETLRPGEQWVIVPGDARAWRTQPLHGPSVSASGPVSGGKVRRRIRSAFADSLQRHMVSDVPVALFLSGGLDSSAIAAVLAEDLGLKPDCFSVVFGGEDAASDESAYARRVASQWNLPHHEIRLSEEEVLEKVRAGLDAMDQPTIDGVNTFIVADAVRRQGVKVALSGLGNDELFCAYPQMRLFSWLNRASRLPFALRSVIAAFLPGSANPFEKRQRLKRLLNLPQPGSLEVYRAIREVWPEHVLLELTDGRCRHVPGDAAALEAEAASGLKQASALEYDYYLPDILLRDADVMGMACSLEIRVPYVDLDWVRTITSLGTSNRFGGPYPKSIFAESILGSLGRDFLERPKAGFVLPFDRWLRGPLKPFAEKFLLDADLQKSVGLCPDAVTRWVRSFYHHRLVSWSRIWSLVVFLHWAAKNRVAGR